MSLDGAFYFLISLKPKQDKALRISNGRKRKPSKALRIDKGPKPKPSKALRPPATAVKYP